MRKGRQFNQIEEEEEKDLFRTDKEKQLYSNSEREQFSSFVRRPITQQQVNNEGDENEDLDTFEAEANQQDETFNKLVNLHKLILKNRITKSNAFDINIGRVELQRYSWVNSSNFLKNLSEILGYKVDNIYQDSYSLLGMLNRTDKEEDEKQSDEKDQKQQKNIKDISSEELLKKVNRYASILNFGSKTIEQKAENIDVNKYDIEFDLDPLLKQTLSQFDDSSNKGLFLTNTYLDKDMVLKLESQVEKQNQIEEQDDEEIDDSAEQDLDVESVPKSSYLRFVKGETSKLNLDKVEKLCPKLMKFKGKVEDDAKKLEINFNLTDSEFVSYTVKKEKKDNQDQNQQKENDDLNHFNDPLDELNQLVNEEFEQKEEFVEVKGQYEYEKEKEKDQQDEEEEEQEDEENDKEKEDIDEEDEEKKKSDQEDIEEEEDDDEEKKEGDGNEDEDEIQVFDPIIAVDKLKNVGKGKIDKELKDKLDSSRQNEKSKNKKKKKNLLQKDQEEQEKSLKKQTNEFRFEFDDLDNEEDKEMCFGTHKKKLNAVDLRKININQKIKHDNLGMFDFGITDELFEQFLLLPGQVQEVEEEIKEQEGNLLMQCQPDENEEYQDFENYDLQQEQLLQNQEEDEEEEPDDFDDIFAKNSNNERSQVRIRDLKKKVWRYIQHQSKKQKKTKKKKDDKQLSFQTVLNDIPNIMGEVSKKISLQSSFITILHLCNENDLKLDDSNQDNANFTIERDRQAIQNQEKLDKKRKQLNKMEEQEEQPEQETEKKVEQEQEQQQQEKVEVEVEVPKDNLEEEEKQQKEENQEKETEQKEEIQEEEEEEEIKQNGEQKAHQNGEQEIEKEAQDNEDIQQQEKQQQLEIDEEEADMEIE